MLPKQHRITASKDIQRSIRTRFQYKTSLVHIYLNQSPSVPFSLLVVVSKKISKRAHERNRIRRKIHAIFSKLLTAGRLPPNVTCTIKVVSKDVIHTSLADIEAELIPAVAHLYRMMIRDH